MKGKILFLAGLGLGYVLGTRDGRERYEQIKAAAGKLWNDPRVQRQVDTVGAFVKDKAPEVAEFVTDSAKKVASQVTATKKPAAKSSAKPRTRSSTTAAKPTGGSSSTAGS